jgi:streptogramin lyase
MVLLIKKSISMKKTLLLLSLFAASVFSATSQVIITVAGNSTVDYGDGSEATYAKVTNPWALAVDDAGNVYFSEPDNSVIRRIGTDGIITRVAGNGTHGYSGDGGDATAAQLNTPCGITLDHSGNLYIADSKNNVIRKVDAAGKITTVAGTGTPGDNGGGMLATAAWLQNPFDVAMDGAGNLYIADAFNYSIKKVNTAGIISIVIGGFSSTLVGGPYGYTGELWFPSNARLSGIALDAAGNLYIADFWDNIIRKVNPAGGMTTIAGSSVNSGFSGDGGPAHSALLYGPKRITVDHAGNVVFSDMNNGRIRKIGIDGKMSTIAGGGSGALGDGVAATSASLNSPVGIAYDNAGNLYIADKGNQRIRKVLPWQVAVTRSSLAKGMMLSPNPSNGAFTVSGTLSGAGAQDVSITVFNILGKVVFDTRLTSVSGTISAQLQLGGGVPNGMYFVNVKGGNETHLLRLVIEK